MFVIYGGTFDMPHNGHRATFDWLRREGHAVIVVPAIGHEFKQYALGSYVYRLAMCRRIFGEDVVPIEEQVLERRPLPIMAIDVLRHARLQLQARMFFARPSTQVAFAIGPDVNVDRWTGIDEIRAEGFEFVRVPEQPGERSSAIRELIATGKPWEHLVPGPVRDFIKLHGLYGWKDR